MVRYLTDSRIEAVLDDMYGYAAAGDYYQAAGAFVEDLEVCYDNGIAADQYNYDPETGRSAATGRCAGMRPCLPGGCGCLRRLCVLGVVREYNMRDEESRMEANFKLSYRKDSAFRMGSRVTDLLIGSYVTQQVIASQDHRSSGRSGGGRSLSPAAAAPPTGPPAEEAMEAGAENFKSRKERNRDMTIMVMDGQGGRRSGKDGADLVIRFLGAPWSGMPKPARSCRI